MKKYFLLLPVAAILWMTGCETHPQPANDNPEPAAQLDTAKWIGKGSEIAGAAFQALSSRLKAALEEGGVPHAVPYCNTAAMPLMDSLSGVHHATIRRVATRYRNPLNKADEAQAAIIHGMEQSLASGTAPKPTVRKLPDGTIAFYSPIILGEPCLKCHGEPTNDIQPENLKIIQNLYPEDKATSFQLGNVRGAWEISFDND